MRPNEMSVSAAVEVSSLTKSYGSRRVLEDVSFAVARGEIFALLGANGAGKTTTIEILAGYRPRDGGTVRVLGMDPADDPRKLASRMGIMLQEGGVPFALKVGEALSLYAAFYRNPLSIEEALSLAGLTGLAGRGIRSLSGGERQRVSLAMAIIGRPDLVFLDEPTVGMDATARRATWSMIRDLTSRGTTIILTTHYLGEAEELAQRVAILHGGKIVAIDTPASLVRAEKNASFSFATATPIDGVELARALNEPVRAENGWTVVDASPTPGLVARVAEHLASRDVLLTGLRIGSATLEEAFLRLTNGEDLDG